MPTVRCSRCGQEHDLSRTEPSFWRPDAFFSVPEEARNGRISHNDDTCLIASTDGQSLTCFLRTVLEVPIKGEGRTIGWGLWVEVSDQAYQRVDELWEAPNQSEEPPLSCTLANEIPEYAGSRGLPGTIRLTSPTTRPSLVLASDSKHPFAVEAREGVHFERSLEWRSWFFHR